VAIVTKVESYDNFNLLLYFTTELSCAPFYVSTHFIKVYTEFASLNFFHAGRLFHHDGLKIKKKTHDKTKSIPATQNIFK